MSLDFLPDDKRAECEEEYMKYLLNGVHKIENYRTMKENEEEPANEVPISSVLSDVEEMNPMDTSTQSITSHITLEKYNTDADTEDEENVDQDENEENVDEDENVENNEEEEREEEGGSENKSEDDGEDEEERELIEKEKSYGTIKTKPSKSRNPVFTPTEHTQDPDPEDYTLSSYELHERRLNQVPITRPFVSTKKCSSVTSSSSASCSSSKSVDSGRVTRGSATKRAKADAIDDDIEDTQDYFSMPKKGKRGKK